MEIAKFLINKPMVEIGSICILYLGSADPDDPQILLDPHLRMEVYVVLDLHPGLSEDLWI